MSDIVVRPGEAEDLPRINDIYNHYVVETPITFDIEPSTTTARREWFSQFDRVGPYRVQVAVEGGTVVGYAATLRFRAKPAYVTSVEVTIYLAHTAVARGLGTRLYAALFDELAGEDLRRAYAGITLPNPASIALHTRFGFTPLGTYTEVGRKFARYWDVLWMEKAL